MQLPAVRIPPEKVDDFCRDATRAFDDIQRQHRHEHEESDTSDKE